MADEDLRRAEVAARRSDLMLAVTTKLSVYPIAGAEGWAGHGATPALRTVLVGCGPRGERHAEGLRARRDRFDLVAVCDLDPARAAALATRLGVPRTYADAPLMLGAERPDLLCFATLPQVRLGLVELGVKQNVGAAKHLFRSPPWAHRDAGALGQRIPGVARV